MSPKRARVVATSALAGTASALFVVPSMVLPGAETSPMLVFVGTVAPAGVAALLWAVKYKDAADLDTRTSHKTRPERETKAGLR